MSLVIPVMIGLSDTAPGGVEQQAWVGPGLLGLGVILGLLALTILLWRNMNKQLRRVNRRYGVPERSRGEGDEDGERDEDTDDVVESPPDGGRGTP